MDKTVCPMQYMFREFWAHERYETICHNGFNVTAQGHHIPGAAIRKISFYDEFSQVHLPQESSYN
jgi:hypothetical protein